MKNDALLDDFKGASEKYELPLNLLLSMAKRESSFDSGAISPKGAAGTMQLMPGTAKEMGVTDVFDQKQNIYGGAKYIKQMIDRFKDINLALAAYNAGPGAVEKHGGIPPFKETQDYVKNVKAGMGDTEVSNSMSMTQVGGKKKSQGPVPWEAIERRMRTIYPTGASFTDDGDERFVPKYTTEDLVKVKKNWTEKNLANLKLEEFDRHLNDYIFPVKPVTRKELEEERAAAYADLDDPDVFGAVAGEDALAGAFSGKKQDRFFKNVLGQAKPAFTPEEKTALRTKWFDHHFNKSAKYKSLDDTTKLKARAKFMGDEEFLPFEMLQDSAEYRSASSAKKEALKNSWFKAFVEPVEKSQEVVSYGTPETGMVDLSTPIDYNNPEFYNQKIKDLRANRKAKGPPADTSILNALSRAARKIGPNLMQYGAGTMATGAELLDKMARGDVLSPVQEPVDENGFLQTLSRQATDIATEAKAEVEKISAEANYGRLWDNPALAKNPAWWVENVIDTAVSMGPALAVGMAKGSLAGGAVSGAMEGSSFFADLVGGENPIEPDKAAIAAAAYGITSAVLNSLGLESMLGKVSKSFLTRAAVGAVGESTTEYLEEPAQAAWESLIRGETPQQAKARVLDSLKNIETGLFGAIGGGVTAGAWGDRGGSQQPQPGQPTQGAPSQLPPGAGPQAGPQPGPRPGPQPGPGTGQGGGLAGGPQYPPGTTFDKEGRPIFHGANNANASPEEDARARARGRSKDAEFGAEDTWEGWSQEAEDYSQEFGNGGKLRAISDRIKRSDTSDTDRNAAFAFWEKIMKERHPADNRPLEEEPGPEASPFEPPPKDVPPEEPAGTTAPEEPEPPKGPKSPGEEPNVITETPVDHIDAPVMGQPGQARPSLPSPSREARLVGKPYGTERRPIRLSDGKQEPGAVLRGLLALPEKPEPGAPASKIESNTMVNNETMGSIEDRVLTGNKGIREELKSILAERIKIEGEEGRNTFKDWMNPAKVGARLVKRGTDAGKQPLDVKREVFEAMREYESIYNDVIGRRVGDGQEEGEEKTGKASGSEVEKWREELRKAVEKAPYRAPSLETLVRKPLAPLKSGKKTDDLSPDVPTQGDGSDLKDTEKKTGDKPGSEGPGKAAGTGGKRGPKETDMHWTSQEEKAKREAEHDYQGKRTRLLEAKDKAAAMEGISEEEAARIIESLDAAPGDDPEARKAIYEAYPDLAPKTEEKAEPEKAERTLADYGLSIHKTVTKKLQPVWEVSGNTRPVKEYLKLAGASWYFKKKVWSFRQSDDPTSKILQHLPALDSEGKVEQTGDAPAKRTFTAPLAKSHRLDSIYNNLTFGRQDAKHLQEVLEELRRYHPLKTVTRRYADKLREEVRKALLDQISKEQNLKHIGENSLGDSIFEKENGDRGYLTNYGTIIWEQDTKHHPRTTFFLTAEERQGGGEERIEDTEPEGEEASEEEEATEEEEEKEEDVEEEEEKPAVDIMDEIANITDEELDALLNNIPTQDEPEKTESKPKEQPGDQGSTAGTAGSGGRTGSPPSGGKTGGEKTPPATRTMKDILAEMASEGVSGAEDALSGLFDLFGGSSLKSFPGGMDEATYAKAKPKFEAALQHFLNAKKSLMEFADFIIKQLGDAIRPYIRRFVMEKRAEQNTTQEDTTEKDLSDNTGKGEAGGRKKLTDEEKAEKERKKKAKEERKAKKEAMGDFRNVGYVYDPEHLNKKTRDKPARTAVKIILDEMVSSKLWGTESIEGSTPGLSRIKDKVQNCFRSFKEYVANDRSKIGYGNRDKSIEERILIQINNGEATIEDVKRWAKEYGETIQPVISSFYGQTSITGAIGKLQDTVMPGVRGYGGVEGAFPDYRTAYDSQMLPELFQYSTGNKFFIGGSSRQFYSLATSDWTQLLAAENDILLSEINVHKRGRNKTVVRTGLPNYRENIELKKTEDFKDPFNFNGVGFGELGWINMEERNRVIPAAFDAFKDLAATIGAPDKGMSIGGQLAVQFANLGHKAKGAAAAYFPTIHTINFTRDNGDGTMAHEWGHGLQDLSSKDMQDEIESAINTFHYVYDFDAGTRLVDELLSKDSKFLKRMVNSKKQQRIEAVKEEVARKFVDIVRKQTDYYKTARMMGGDYTSNQQEMWARAFEAYVYDNLAGHNNYLVNDFVSAGRVGGKAEVGTMLVYPAGKERETFNATIKYLLENAEWDANGQPSMKEGFVPISQAEDIMLKLRLQFLLDQIEERYKAIWASEPSPDGFFWYRYDVMSFAPAMQPDGYAGWDKEYKEEGQGGKGAVAYRDQLHPDDILDYKLTNVQYNGENATYLPDDAKGFGDDFREDGSEALEEVSSGDERGTGEEGDLRPGGKPGGRGGEGGTRTPGTKREPDGSGEGDSAGGVHSPAPRDNYRIVDPTLNDPKSKDTRYLNNLSAVRILKKVEEEKRSATPDEKDVMAQYSGWGGLAEIFSYAPTEAWAARAELVKAELDHDEQSSAGSSAPTAYYTPVPIGRFMWKLAQRLGLERGNVLDPAVGGNGLFFGTMPEELAGSVSLQGIDRDPLSVRIASQLYELASIEAKPFQDARKPINRYDLAITNVPFENLVPTDSKHNKGGHKLHNYFINKMLDLTAHGALCMAITTSRTMDNAGKHLEEYAKKADLVGAIRLPSGIYSATDVVTDILVFRKKIAGSKFEGIPVEDWTTAGIDESTGLTLNTYFLKHPEMVAGKLETTKNQWGSNVIRVVSEGNLERTLEDLAAAFPDKIVEREVVKELENIDDIVSAPGTIKEGGLYVNDKNQVCAKENGEEIVWPTGTASEKKKAEIARGFIGILDAVRAALRVQRTEGSEAEIKAEQANLAKLYKAFVKKFGPINDPQNTKVYMDVTDSDWVIALEEYDPDEKKVVKLADIFTKNVAGAAQRPQRADSDHDALAMSLDEFGYPNLDYMAKLRDSDVESVLAGVTDKIIENPETGMLETMDEYLAGNVKRKLAVAREMAKDNPEYERNVTLLESSLPPEIPAHRITARIGAPWVDPEHLSAFVIEKMNIDVSNLTPVFNFNPVSNEWTMTFKGRYNYSRGREIEAETQRQIYKVEESVEATREWGTDRRNFLELMKDAITGDTPVVTYRENGRTFTDPVATKAANAKLEQIQLEFGQWLFRETYRAEQAVKRFNELVNTSVPYKGDGSHLTFPGKSMAMITPKEQETLGIGNAVVFYKHQMNAVWKYQRAGNIYLAHEVGAGKTATMVLTAMEAKRLRGKKKVLYVTLNDSTMGQAIQEFKKLYPLCKLMPVRVSTQEQRQQKVLQKLAMNEFDVAIMRQQDLDRIALSPETENVFINAELEELRASLNEAKAAGARIQQQQIEDRINKLNEDLRKTVHEEAKERNLYFDDIGFDLMIVDEAHIYKNVPFTTKLEKIVGLNPGGSKTAAAFFRKTQYMNSQFPKQDGVILATGSPLTNSIAELYNIQRMIHPKEVKRLGVWSFDRWIASYGDIGADLEWDGARQQFKNVTVNRRIVNAGRLLGVLYNNVDSIRAKDTEMKRPVIRGGEPHRIVVKPNQYVEDYKRIVAARANSYDADPKNAMYRESSQAEMKADNMLRIISNMSLVAIDQRLLGGGTDPQGNPLPGPYADTEMQEDSKIYRAAELIRQRWEEEKQHKGVQLVFADLGVPKRFMAGFKMKTDEELEKLTDEQLTKYREKKHEYDNASALFNVYDGLKQELIKRGIPEKEIAFIHDADHPNKDKKAANLRSLFAKVNSGEIRVLFGSTSKAGTGVNIQERVSDAHHLDIWWNFSALEQRNGRAIRPGNIYGNEGMPGVYIHYYVTETTVDATRWDKVFSKGRTLNAILGGDINLDVAEDISEETMSAKMTAAQASGNPLAATQATLMNQVQGLRLELSGFLDNVSGARSELTYLPSRIETREKWIAEIKKSREVMSQVTAVQFVGDSHAYSLEKDGKEIAKKLNEAVAKSKWSSDGDENLFVLGSHTDKEVTKEVDGKQVKTKERTFSPLPVTGRLTHGKKEHEDKGLVLYGDIASTSRTLATHVGSIPKVADGVKTFWDVKANVSRTVTEYLTNSDKTEAGHLRDIAEFKEKIPKLEKIVATPWPKEQELSTKTLELYTINTQIAATTQGAGVADPAKGAPIDKYQSQVPVLEDVMKKDGWSRSMTRGQDSHVLFSGYNDETNEYAEVGIRMEVGGKPVNLGSYARAKGKFEPNITTIPPDRIRVLIGTKPESPATKPFAFSEKSDGHRLITKLWVSTGKRPAWVNPKQWGLMSRIVGKTGTWHYVEHSDGQGYLVHVDTNGQRDAYIEAEESYDAPENVRNLHRGMQERAAHGIPETPDDTSTGDPGTARYNQPIDDRVEERTAEFGDIDRENASQQAKDIRKLYGGGPPTEEVVEFAKLLFKGSRVVIKKGKRLVVKLGKIAKKTLRDESGSVKVPDFMRKAFAEIRDEDISLVEKSTSIPRWTAKRHKEFDPSWNVEQTRQLERHLLTEDFLEGIEPFLKARSFPAAERKPLVDLIWECDEKGIIPGTPAYGALVRRLGVSQRAVEAYKSAREVFDYVRDDFIPDLLHQFGASDNEINEARQRMGRLSGYWPHMREGKYFVRVSDEVFHISLDKALPWIKVKKADRPELKKFMAYCRKHNIKPQSPDFVAVLRNYQLSNDTLDILRRTADAIEHIRANFLVTKPYDISSAKQYLEGFYASLGMKPKKHGVEGGRETMWREHYDDIVATASSPIMHILGKENRLSPKGAYKKAQLKKQFPDGTVELGINRRLPEEMFFNIDPAAMEQIISLASGRAEKARIEEIKNSSMTQDEKDRLINQIRSGGLEKETVRAVAEILMSRGFMSHAMGRTGVPGFDRTNPWESAIQYFVGLAGFAAKVRAAPKFHKALSAIPADKKPRLYEYASKFIHDAMQVSDQFDRSVSKVRGGIFYYYLGGVTKSAALQLTQNVVAGVPKLATETNWATAKIAKEMALSAKDILVDIYQVATRHQGPKAKERRLSSGEFAGLSRARKTGVVADLTTEELIGHTLGKFGTFTRRIGNALRFMFGRAEIFNRETMWVTAYRVGIKEKGKTHEQAMNYADSITLDVHFLYNKSNLPPFARGGQVEKAVRASYSFRTFAQNILQLYGSLFREHGGNQKRFKSFMGALLALLALGGLRGVPFFSDMEDEIQQQTGFNIRSAIAGKLNGWTKDIILYGLPGLLGIDLAGSIAIELPRSVKDLPGVLANLFYETPKNVINDLRLGDYKRAAEDAAPVFLKNILAASRVSGEGLSTRGGKAITDDEGEPIKLSPYEQMMKSLGFQPVKLSENYRKHAARTNAKKYWSGKRDSLLDAYHRMKIRYDLGSEEVENVLVKIRNFNQERPAYIAHIDTTTLKARTRGKTKNERILQNAVK